MEHHAWNWLLIILLNFAETKGIYHGSWSKAKFSQKAASGELSRTWKWSDFAPWNYCNSVPYVPILYSLYWLVFIYLVSFCFLKLKSKRKYKWWISMRYQNQRMPTLPRIKVAFRGGITAEFLSQLSATTKLQVCITPKAMLGKLGFTKSG